MVEVFIIKGLLTVAENGILSHDLLRLRELGVDPR